MGQRTVSTSIATMTDSTNLPVEIANFSTEHGLTVAEAWDVQLIVSEHETNLPSVRTLLEEGLTVTEVGEVYDARARLNTALASAERTQGISLKAIVAFQRQFPELALDADCLTEHLLQIQEDLPTRYFSSALAAITSAAQWYDHCFADVLAAYLNGDLEEMDA